MLASIRETRSVAAAPDPQSRESSVHRERGDVSVCVQEEEAERGRRAREINIQRKRGKERPPSFSGRLGCSRQGVEEVACVSVNVCVLWRAWCWHRNCLQEAAVPGGAPLADALRSLPVCSEAGRHARTHIHTHTLSCTHTRTGLERGRALAWRAVQRNERAREGGMEGGREGGRREFSREQHFPTVWGFDTWLSHIPQPCGRPSIGTQGEEGERERERQRVREEGSTLGACEQYGVMEGRECGSVCACALRVFVLTCVCLMHRCLTLSQPPLARQTVSDTQKLAGRETGHQAEDRRLFY